MIGNIVIIDLVSYLLGSLSFSVIFSRLIGGDIRKKGSGNAGATNMARIYGAFAGFATLAFDGLKAAAAILIGYILMGDIGIAVAGLFCIVGHCFPVFYDFRGGKGVSVGGVIAFCIDWRVGLLVVAVFLVVAFSTRKVSLGSCAAAIAASIGCLIFAVSTPKLILAIACTVIVIYQHRANIKRVIEGTEPDFKFAKPKNK